LNYLWDNIFKRQEREQDIRKYRSGEDIFKQNEAGVGMYIIVKGRVDISVLDDNLTERDREKEIIVTTLEAGDFFGELSLVEEISTRSATARASEDSILIGFFKSDLLEILDRSPEAGIKIVFRLAEVLGRRLKETTDRISQLKKEIRLLGELQEVSRDTRRITPEKN
jgi:CRP/FNR family cyclic AMP-dependent transcriptional regulator